MKNYTMKKRKKVTSQDIELVQEWDNHKKKIPCKEIYLIISYEKTPSTS